MGEWVRAKGCSSHTCVEVQQSPGDGRMVAIRAGQLPGMTVIASKAEWRVFVQGVKDGDFDDLG